MGGTGAGATSYLEESLRKKFGRDAFFDFLGALSQNVSGTKRKRRMPQKPTIMATILKMLLALYILTWGEGESGLPKHPSPTESLNNGSTDQRDQVLSTE